VTQLLEGKNAMISGAGGRIGGGVARTFADRMGRPGWLPTQAPRQSRTCVG